MSARRKLNQGYIQGCLVLAAVVGFVCQSWAAFWITAVILVGLSMHAGEIRHGGRPPRSRRRRRRPRDNYFQ